MLERLRNTTGETAQLWVRRSDERICLPNPLFVTDGVLSGDAWEHLLASDDGRVVIDCPPGDQRGLDVLEPVFGVVRSITAGYGVDDFSLLPRIPHLEVPEIRDKVRIAPARQVWSELRGFDGEWQAGVEDFASAPHMKSLLLIRATQKALDLIQGPLDYIGLRRPNLPARSAGWRDGRTRPRLCISTPLRRWTSETSAT